MTLPLLYERLPDFCYICSRIGHIFRECPEETRSSKLELGQPDFDYGPWLRASTMAEKLKQSRSKEKASGKLAMAELDNRRGTNGENPSIQEKQSGPDPESNHQSAENTVDTMTPQNTENSNQTPRSFLQSGEQIIIDSPTTLNNLKQGEYLSNSPSKTFKRASDNEYVDQCCSQNTPKSSELLHQPIPKNQSKSKEDNQSYHAYVKRGKEKKWKQWARSQPIPKLGNAK